MTWNPVRDYSRVSTECDNRDPETLDKVIRGKPHSTGAVELLPHKLQEPGQQVHPYRILVNSMSDLFHESLADADIDQVFAVMAQCPQHSFQVLTKHPERLREYSRRFCKARRGGTAWRTVFHRAKAIPGRRRWWPLSNVWLGVSVEHEGTAALRIPVLRDTLAAVRWVSYEPALGPVDWDRWLPEVDWVVCGGGSGEGARPMQLDWARAARDACAEMCVPFYFKRWGAWAPDGKGGMMRFCMKEAVRRLDGRTHDEFPV